MGRQLIVNVERWPVAGAFTIARGSKTYVDVVMVALHEGGVCGRGEATPIYYHGETAETVATSIEAIRPLLEGGLERGRLSRHLARGAARNAVDSALWDLDAKRAGTSVANLINPGHSPQGLITAFTLSLDSPQAMGESASRAADHYPLLKLKLAGEGDIERVAAVRAGAPDARLIVDANEAWTDRNVAEEAAALVPYGVELIEQPVRAGEDALLDGVCSPIPLCADESCQDRADLDRCLGRYQAINIKLDKSGGLTEALALRDAAAEHGLDIMVGCMLSTSLGVAPAFFLAQQARWVDLDGPLLLARDRIPGVVFNEARMQVPDPALWG